MPQTAQTTWPEGVIARYLTAAGAALADPAICTDVIANDDDYDSARCVCGSTASYDMDTARLIAEPDGDSFCLPDEPSVLAWRWAREHAETCRALPRPTARR
ncbi:hypothetical protein ABZ705_01010 [Streptomyces sp. NPDC006984]|uniref:hypothetical protein n=1 Tax=Streptomyces sp. NPDC006984 TaxID=3155463 RepID=UPI0034008A64